MLQLYNEILEHPSVNVALRWTLNYYGCRNFSKRSIPRAQSSRIGAPLFFTFEGVGHLVS